VVSESTKNIVKSLREARDERGLTITDLVAQTGISESTIRRVFLDDIDNISGFSYEGTLAPLIDLLLKKGDIEDSALSQTRIDGLLALIAVKDETIANIKRQIEEQKNAQQTKCKKCAEEVDFLKRQIDLKDARMDKKDEWIDRLLGHIEEMLHK
jgi:predicted transcriptional regulator